MGARLLGACRAMEMFGHRQYGLLLLFLIWAFHAQAGGVSYKKNQYYRGITSHFAITFVAQADLDGDGRDEIVVCYREPEDAVDQPGGVLILTGGPKQFVVGWHAMFEKVYPARVSAKGKALDFELVHKTAGEDERHRKTLVKGKDFFFRRDGGSPFAGVTISASSTLRKEGIAAANVFDRDLRSGWAEGADGTGVDEKVTFEFSKPVHLALVGVLHGDYRGKRHWLDNNRLHRAVVTVETSADRYDTESDVDFSEDLGLGLYGDRVELNFSNRPVMHYFRLDKKAALSLELKITSVLLGERNDDTYLAEIDLAELIPAAAILGEKKPPTEKAAKEQKQPEEEEEEGDWIEDDF